MSSSGKLKIFKSTEEWLNFRKSLKGTTLGFIPTMGALHKGHLSLVDRSKKENEKTLVSIFVNPTQFDDKVDLEKYPRTLEADVDLLTAAGVDFLLFPQAEDLYLDGFKFRVEETSLSSILCGASRPGHFTGVLTVVMKLLQLAQSDRAYFGEKDYQQYLLVKRMAEAFFLPVQIVGCATVREADGLAMSSRNRRLSSSDRERASKFSKILRSSPTATAAKEVLQREGFSVDYVEDHFGRRLGAVKIGGVRLIDNVQI